MKNSPRRQRNLVPAFGALISSLVYHFICVLVPASRTDEDIRPPTSRPVMLTGLLP